MPILSCRLAKWFKFSLLPFFSVLFIVTIIMYLVSTIVRQTVNISQAVYATILLAEKCERSSVWNKVEPRSLHQEHCFGLK